MGKNGIEVEGKKIRIEATESGRFILNLYNMGKTEASRSFSREELKQFSDKICELLNKETASPNTENKVFRCNEDGVAEWCIAVDKKQAYDFMSNLWGASTMKEYENEYFEDNKGALLEDFIEDFFTEEPSDKDFTIIDAGEDGGPVTKKISEWIEGQSTVPSYFCCEQW